MRFMMGGDRREAARGVWIGEVDLLRVCMDFLCVLRKRGYARWWKIEARVTREVILPQPFAVFNVDGVKVFLQARPNGLV